MNDRPTHPAIDYERTDPHWKKLVLVSLSVVMAVFLILGLLWSIYEKRLVILKPPEDVAAQFSFTNGPSWRSPIVHDREALWKTEQKRLTSLRWLDEEDDVMQVPIDQTLDLVVEQGLPHWAPIEAPENSPYALAPNDE